MVWASTGFYPSLHKQTEYLDVILETRFNLVLHTVIQHSQITPERPQINKKAPNIMCLEHIIFAGPRQTIFVHSPLPKSGSISV